MLTSRTPYHAIMAMICAEMALPNRHLVTLFLGFDDDMMMTAEDIDPSEGKGDDWGRIRRRLANSNTSKRYVRTVFVLSCRRREE